LSQRVRIGILVGIIGIALAAAGIFGLTRLLQQALTPLPPPTPEAAIIEEVVVTTHNVALGTVLRANDLRTIEVPVELAPPGVVTDLETAVGKFSKVDLIQGELLFRHQLADPTNVTHDVAFILDEYQVLMAFPANDLMSSLSVIQRGDLVDILVTRSQAAPPEPEEEADLGTVTEEEARVEETFTFDAMQRLEVTALVVDIVEEQQQQQAPAIPGVEQQDAPPPPEPEYKIRAYLFALVPQDALVLKHLKDTGATFDFVLRSPTSSQLFELSPVTSEYLNDRYELQAPRP